MPCSAVPAYLAEQGRAAARCSPGRRLSACSPAGQPPCRRARGMSACAETRVRGGQRAAGGVRCGIEVHCASSSGKRRGRPANLDQDCGWIDRGKCISRPRPCPARPARSAHKFLPAQPRSPSPPSLARAFPCVPACLPAHASRFAPLTSVVSTRSRRRRYLGPCQPRRPPTRPRACRGWYPVPRAAVPGQTAPATLPPPPHNTARRQKAGR